MNIQLKITGAGKDSMVPDNATSIDLDVIIGGKTTVSVTVAADPHDQRPIMYGADAEYWCSHPADLSGAYDGDMELAEEDILSALSELLDTPEAPMYWSGGFWTGE